MKTHFCSKPFIILKHHSPPIFPSFHFPVPLWHISVLPAGFFPFSTQVSAWYPSLWYQSSSPLDRHTNTLCLRPPAGWDRAGTGLGPEFRRGQKHNPSGADSHSWTLKYNALISRSACSYKSNGFNANHACQRSTKRLQFSPDSHIQPLRSLNTPALPLPPRRQGRAHGVPAAPLYLGPLQLCLCRASVRSHRWNLAPESKFQENKHYH